MRPCHSLRPCLTPQCVCVGGGGGGYRVGDTSGGAPTEGQVLCVDTAGGRYCEGPLSRRPAKGGAAQQGHVYVYISISLYLYPYL